MKHLNPFESADEEDIKNIFIDLFDEFPNLEFTISTNRNEILVSSKLLSIKGESHIFQRSQFEELSKDVRIFLDEEIINRMYDVGFYLKEYGVTGYHMGYNIILKFGKIRKKLI